MTSSDITRESLLENIRLYNLSQEPKNAETFDEILKKLDVESIQGRDRITVKVADYPQLGIRPTYFLDRIKEKGLFARIGGEYCGKWWIISVNEL